MQTNDICFINDEFNEKQALDNSFCFDEQLLDEILKANITESDNNKCLTSISDKISYSILKLENSVKSDSLALPKDLEEHHGIDLSSELDYESINQIMSDFFSNSFDINNSDYYENNFASQKTTNLIDFDLNSDVLVQKIDPMISNGLFDLKLI